MTGWDHACYSELREIRQLLAEHLAGPPPSPMHRLVQASPEQDTVTGTDPLPEEGDVVHVDEHGRRTILWRRRGVLYLTPTSSAAWSTVAKARDHLSPLRATVTAADVEALATDSDLWASTGIDQAEAGARLRRALRRRGLGPWGP